MLDELRSHNIAWKERRLKAARLAEPPCSGVLHRDRPPDRPGARVAIVRTLGSGGRGKRTPHDSRRTHITATVSPAATWPSPHGSGTGTLTTTLKTYAQVVPQMDDELLEIVGRVVPRKAGTGA